MKREITIGEWLRQRRRQVDLTQKALAHLAGCSVGTVRKIEADERKPSWQLARLLAKHLDIAPEKTDAFVSFLRSESYYADDSFLDQIPSIPKAATSDIPDLSIPKIKISQKMPLEVGSHHPADLNFDIREAPEIPVFFGREIELGQLKSWISEKQYRLVAVLGIGGQGKTTLANRYARHVTDDRSQPIFTQVLWRSLLNAPPLSDLLPEILQFFSRQQLAEVPARLDQRLDLLMEIFQQERCLLVLDNFDSLLREGPGAGTYREGYEDYGQLVMRIGQHSHQGSLLLTSREATQTVRRLAKDSVKVQLLNLEGLSMVAGNQLLQQRGLDVDGSSLINRYSGNPLALKLVADTVDELFFGDVQAFLSEETLIFDDIRQVLVQQFDRLSPLEQDILTWLAIEMEPLSPEEIWNDLLPGESRRDFLEALRSLQRRSLLEKSPGGLTLQNVIAEFLTERWVEQACDSIENGNVEGINRHSLIKAQSKSYIRNSQERLILQPTAERLLSKMSQAGLEAALARMRDDLRALPTPLTGYAGGNILNLLIYLGGDLNHADFSDLAIWQAYLQGKMARGVNFKGSDLRDPLLTETFGAVMSVAFSPDGTMLAAGGTGTIIKVWRVSDGAPIVLIESRHDWIWSLDFSPDSKYLAGAGPAGGTAIENTSTEEIVIWDAQTGQKLSRKWEAEPLDVPHSVVFSPDGRFLASGHRDHVVYLWEVEQALKLEIIRPIKKLRGEGSSVLALAFSPDGQYLASGDWEQSLMLWEIESGHSLADLENDNTGIWAVAFSPDGQTLASGGVDHQIRLWDVSVLIKGGDALPFRSLSGHADWVRSVHFHPEGKILASAGEDQTVWLWDVHSGKILQVLHGHTQKVTSVGFHPDGELLASGSDDQTVRLWDVAANEYGVLSSRSLRTVPGDSTRLWSLSFSPDGKMLASGGGDNTIWLWDMSNIFSDEEELQISNDAVSPGQPFMALEGHTDEVASVSISPDGGKIASGSWDQTIRLWDARTGNLLAILEGHTNELGQVLFSPDGRTLASSGLDGTLCFWDVGGAEFNQKFSIKLYRGIPSGIDLEFSPDNKYLVTSNFENRMIQIWDMQRGEPRILNTLQGFDSPCAAISFSPDGSLLAGSFDDGSILIWLFSEPEDLNAGNYYRALRSHSRIYTIAFSPDGRRLASGGQGDEYLQFWDLKDSGEPESDQSRHVISGFGKRNERIAFSPSGEFIACREHEGIIRLIDVKRGKLLKSLRVDRPYERMDITRVTGLTAGQKASMKALGAIEKDT